MPAPLQPRDAIARAAHKVPRVVWTSLYKDDDDDAAYQLADELLKALGKAGWSVVKRPTAKK